MFHRPDYIRMIVGAIAAAVVWYVILAAVWVTLCLGPRVAYDLLLGNSHMPIMSELMACARAAFFVPGGGWTLYTPYGFYSGSSSGMGYVAVAAVGTAAVFLMPLCFLSLPYTFRNAKVRRFHLLRITAWSIIVPPLIPQGVVMFGVMVGNLASISQGVFIDVPYLDLVLEHQSRTVFLLTVLWLWYWWSTACQRYLGLPRARLVALAMVAMAFLTALILTLPYPALLRSLFF
jgi:hypothetical protein